MGDFKFKYVGGTLKKCKLVKEEGRYFFQTADINGSTVYIPIQGNIAGLQVVDAHTKKSTLGAIAGGAAGGLIFRSPAGAFAGALVGSVGKTETLVAITLKNGDRAAGVVDARTLAWLQELSRPKPDYGIPGLDKFKW